MQGNKVVIAVPLPGTLAANVTMAVPLDFDCTLVAVSATASNDSDATLQVGTVADPDGILTATVIGDSDARVTYTAADFDGALAVGDSVSPIALEKTDELHFTLDFDGAAGTAAQNVCITFTLVE
jgi:hypothetical protein